MSVVYFLAAKIRNSLTTSFSATVVQVGVASIAIGVATMILAFSILFGFKQRIKNKLFGLSSHVQVSKITLNRSFDETPLVKSSQMEEIFKENRQIKQFHGVINKAAILKSDDEIGGILLKGISTDYDSTLFKLNLTEGRWLKLNDSTDVREILLSTTIAKKLKIKLNDDALVYFVQNPPRARKLKVVGMYDTGLIDFDKNLIFCDLKLLQKLNNWNKTQIGHYEIFLTNFDELPLVEKSLNDQLPQELYVRPITKLVPQFFEWFNLLDRNILLVIVLIMVVAAFNMISVLLIMIMERIPMIGLLKAIGMENQKIRRVFITNGFLIIIKGLMYGNIIGLGIAYAQQYFRIIPLDPESYYVDYVPIIVSFESVVLVNLIVIVIVGLTLLLPTLFIGKVNPVSALKYKD